MPIKIGYDARMIENSGIGIRIQHILKYWPIPNSLASLTIFGDPDTIQKYEIPTHANIICYTAPIYSFKELKGHPEMKKMDILDIPHFNIPLPYLRKSIVTIHDLIPFHFKSAHGSLAKRIYLNIIFRLIRSFAKKIITVSEFTKQDLVSTFAVRKEKVTVIYNGIDDRSFRKQTAKDIDSFRRQFHLPKEYLFTVGIGKAHKNFPFLLSSLEEIWSDKKLKLPLVIGGIGKEIPFELLEFQKRFPNKIFFLSHVPYSKLPLAYAGAKIFLYASLYEGFGFPILEAQATETPVLSSNVSVMTEILEGTAEYFDPRNKADFQERLLNLLNNPKLQRNLVQRGKLNRKRFLWASAIQKLDSFYRETILTQSL
ncbi:MAG: glycosyltransferase family 4 protein [Leptospira sp.]|nr:glycosyltransferase family 4 protein [Leptospira sp.]